MTPRLFASMGLVWILVAVVVLVPEFVNAQDPAAAVKTARPASFGLCRGGRCG